VLGGPHHHAVVGNHLDPGSEWNHGRHQRGRYQHLENPLQFAWHGGVFDASPAEIQCRAALFGRAELEHPAVHPIEHGPGNERKSHGHAEIVQVFPQIRAPAKAQVIHRAGVLAQPKRDQPAPQCGEIRLVPPPQPDDPDE